MTASQLTPSKPFDRVAAELGQRKVDGALVELLREFAKTHTVEICAKGSGVLPLSAAHDAYAAVYVGRTSLSVALDPVVARRISEVTGNRVEPKTNVTSYLHFHSDDLAEAAGRDHATDALDRAFTRAYHGPRWSRGLPDQQHSQGTVCPTCNLQMSVNGSCDNCD